MKGIDVSKHQGTIDWDKVKAAGIGFAIIRAGYGKSTIDEQFVRNITACHRLGIPCGVYWFSYAKNVAEAKREAESCLAAVKPYRLEFPIFFDLEYDTDRYLKQQGITLTKAMATAHAEAFLSTIEAAGYYAANYANPDYLSRFFDSGLQQKYDLWLANFKENADTASPPRSCGIWQHWNKGKIDGISGNVDLDVSYKDYPTIIRNAGLNGLTVAGGWFQYQGKWYWYENGQMVKSAWREVTGKNGTYKYYLGADGAMLKGEQVINGIRYYLHETAAGGLPEGALWITDSNGAVQI